MKTTNVHIILDSSGSMDMIKSATISGFNEYVGTLRKEKKISYKMSLTLFNTDIDKRYVNEPLKGVKDLNSETYRPNNMTALYDAVCQTVKDIEGETRKNQRHVVVIMTDGLENSSREYTEKDFKNVVERLQEKGNWTFVYLGANQDSWGEAAKWGFKEDNVADFNATMRGQAAVFANTAMATNSFSMSSAPSSSKFYSATQKRDIKKAK